MRKIDQGWYFAIGAWFLNLFWSNMLGRQLALR